MPGFESQRKRWREVVLAFFKDAESEGEGVEGWGEVVGVRREERREELLQLPGGFGGRGLDEWQVGGGPSFDLAGEKRTPGSRFGFELALAGGFGFGDSALDYQLAPVAGPGYLERKRKMV